MNLKIVVIGAGSLSFTPLLLRDFGQFEDLFGSKIVLMDIDDSKLPQVLDIAKRINKVAGANYIFETTTDRKEALENADYALYLESSLIYAVCFLLQAMVISLNLYIFTQKKNGLNTM